MSFRCESHVHESLNETNIMFYPGLHQRLQYLCQRKIVARDKTGLDSSNSLREGSCLPAPSPSLSLGEPHLDGDHRGRRRSSTSSTPGSALPTDPTNRLQLRLLKKPCWAERTSGLGGSTHGQPLRKLSKQEQGRCSCPGRLQGTASGSTRSWRDVACHLMSVSNNQRAALISHASWTHTSHTCACNWIYGVNGFTFKNNYR